MPIIDVDGLRVNYNDAGSGVPLVFVPGLGASGDWFCYQSSGLSDRYRVITYDLRRARRRTRYSLDLLVDDLSRFLSALHIYSAVVVGHSLGGLVALKFAASHPDHCPALVLASVTPSFPNLPDDEMQDHLLPGKIITESFAARLWKRLFKAKKNSEDNGSSLGCLAQHMANTDRATLSAQMRLLRETDLTPLLSSIAVPTLIIVDLSERPYVLAGAQVLEEGIANSSLEVIEDAEQFYFHTRHDQFNAILSDFLEQEIARF